MLLAVLVFSATVSRSATVPRAASTRADAGDAGLLDPQFGGDGTVTIHVGGKQSRSSGHALAIQPDGKVIVAGQAGVPGYGTRFAVARLNVDGTLDRRFAGDGRRTIGFGKPHIRYPDPRYPSEVLYSAARGVAVQPDGKIVIAGTAAKHRTWDDFALVRLLPHGGLDRSFGSNGKVTIAFGGRRHDDIDESLALLPGGKILLSGYTQGSGFSLARFNRNGSLDRSFGHHGRRRLRFKIYDTAVGMEVARNGKIALAGYEATVARLNRNGSLDHHFSRDGHRGIRHPYHAGGWKHYNSVWGLAAQSDGKIVLTGCAWAVHGPLHAFGVLRLNRNGSLDRSFANRGSRIVTIPGSTDLACANEVAIDADNRIVLAGDADHHGDVDFALLRLMPDGRLDRGFGTNGRQTTPFGQSKDFYDNWDSPEAIGFSPAGKIVVAGYAGGCGNAPTEEGCNFAVARYLP